MKDLQNVLHKKIAFIILVLSMFFSLQGCMQYYKVKKVNNVSVQEISQFIANKRFIIVHQDSLTRYLSNPQLSGNVLTGELLNLTKNQMKFKSTKPKGATRYRNNMTHREKYVINEVHLYLQKTVIQDFRTAQKVMIPLSDITNADVYQMATGKTIFSWVYPGLTYLTVSGVVIVIMIKVFMESFHLDIM
jgi:uncharacterized lipoprotein YehR (DUF1307 family)